MTLSAWLDSVNKFSRWVTLTKPSAWEWPKAEPYAQAHKFYSTGRIVLLLGTTSQMHRFTKVKLRLWHLSRSALPQQTMRATAQSFSTQSECSTTPPIRRYQADSLRTHSQSGSKTLARSIPWPQVQAYQTTSTRLIREQRPSHWTTLQVYPHQSVRWQPCAKFFQLWNASGRAAQHRKNIKSFIALFRLRQVHS